MTIEDIRSMEAEALKRVRSSLEPIRQTLAEQAFLSGDTPAFTDYCVMGGFMWARTTYAPQVLEPDDPVEAWRQRMLDLFDGMGRKTLSLEA